MNKHMCNLKPVSQVLAFPLKINDYRENPRTTIYEAKEKLKDTTAAEDLFFFLSQRKKK